MAVRTVRLKEANDGLVLWELDWNDATLNVIQFRCRNDSSQAAFSRLWLQADPTTVWSRRTEPGTFDNIPLANLHIATINGRIADLEGEFTWPVP